MSIDTFIPEELMAELQEAADNAAVGIRNPDAMREACEDMDRISEAVFQKYGVLDIGLQAIRDLRG